MCIVCITELSVSCATLWCLTSLLDFAMSIKVFVSDVVDRFSSISLSQVETPWAT